MSLGLDLLLYPLFHLSINARSDEDNKLTATKISQHIIIIMNLARQKKIPTKSHKISKQVLGI